MNPIRFFKASRYPAMADPVAIQDEIALLEKNLAEIQSQLQDAKSRLQKAQSQAVDRSGQQEMSVAEPGDYGGGFEQGRELEGLLGNRDNGQTALRLRTLPCLAVTVIVC